MGRTQRKEAGTEARLHGEGREERGVEGRRSEDRSEGKERNGKKRTRNVGINAFRPRFASRGRIAAAVSA
jgi:hypothetical protein